ncbi:hypothetical protein N665_0173s0006 [Sinapis alba]|nr:hypothetical protein N665_0173s0006 [Sinapis alba]
MYIGLVRFLTLSFLLFSGLSDTVLARVQYESPKLSRQEVWDHKVIREIKIATPGSCTPPGGGRSSPSHSMRGPRRRCPRP